MRLKRGERMALETAIAVCDQHPEYTTNGAAATAMRTMLKESASTGGGTGSPAPPIGQPPGTTTPPVLPPNSKVIVGPVMDTDTVFNSDTDPAPGLIVRDAILTAARYCLFIRDPFQIVRSVLESVGPGDCYPIRSTAPGFDISDSTLDNSVSSTTKNTLRATGFTLAIIRRTNTKGDGWLLGYGASDHVVNRLGCSGLRVGESTSRMTIEITPNKGMQSAIDLSDTAHDTRWENVDIKTPWPASAINLWDGSHDHEFKGCTVNGAPMTTSNIRHVRAGVPIPLLDVKVIP